MTSQDFNETAQKGRDTAMLAGLGDRDFLMRCKDENGYKAGYNHRNYTMGDYTLAGKYKVVSEEAVFMPHQDSPHPVLKTLTVFDFEKREVTTHTTGIARGRDSHGFMQTENQPPTTQTRAFRDIGNPLTLEKAYDALIKLGGLEIDWKSPPQKINEIVKNAKIGGLDITLTPKKQRSGNDCE